MFFSSKTFFFNSMPKVPSETYVIPSEDILPNVLKVLGLINMSIDPKRQNASAKTALLKAKPPVVLTIGRKCINFTNSCLVSHRYQQAAQLLWILCQNRSVFDTYLFKATMIVLENLDTFNNDETVWNLHREIQRLPDVNKKEIQLEFIIYGLKNNTFDLQKRATELISMKKSTMLRKLHILDPTFEAYRAFLFYYEWCHSSVGSMQFSQAKSSAENAILQFKKVIEDPGDWDIFVLNLCSMLQFCDQSEEIEDVLLKYVQCNPAHINAHIYICTYLYHYAPDSEKLIEHLKTLAELCPSEERVLWLVEKLSNTGKKHSKCLKLLFMFLDYPSNGKNIQAWEMLSNLLLQGKSEKKTTDISDSLWKSRSRCWHWMYFNPLQVGGITEADCLLVSLKLKVLLHFDKEHGFIKTALKMFPGLMDDAPDNDMI